MSVGAVVGARFELVREMGRGGFGVVWEARDRELGRRVAFKAVRPGSLRGLREERLLREAEAAASLSHPNIVTLFDVGRSEHGPYLVLELLDGKTLAERLSHGALPVREALHVAVEVAKGLAHAHAHGVVHRDLKPENVFLCDDGRVKVLDFGLAHAFGHRRLDGGTPAYMAPEQAEGSPEDERTDVWALGAILFEMLSGRRASARRGAFIEAPVLEVPGSPALGELVARMLALQPRDRPRDAGEVLPALSSFAAEVGRSPPAERSVTVHGKPSRRVLALIAAALAVAALATAFLPCAWSVAWKPCTYVRASRVGPRTPGPATDARVRVLVTDIVNDTGDRDLDVLSRLLVTSLEQSRRLAVMTPERVLDLARQAAKKDVARVDEHLGRELGQEHGVRAVLVPAVHRFAATYSLELRAIDPVRDEHLFTLRERATSRDALIDVIDRLSERAREDLRETSAEVESARIRIADAMTASVEAYQHYSAGMETWYRDALRAAALGEFLEAVRLDPRFAAAHHALAKLYDAYGRPDLAAPHWRAAREDLDRMPEKERKLIRLARATPSQVSGAAGPSAGHWSRDEALRLADELVARFPEDKVVLVEAAAAYKSVDQGGRAEEALRKALELDPAFSLAARLIGAHVAAAERLEIARRAVATRRSASNLAVLAASLLSNGSDAEAAEAATEALRVDGGRNSFLVLTACRTLYSAGRGGGCVPQWTRMAAEGVNEVEREYARTWLAVSLATRGRMREARAVLGSLDDPRWGLPARFAMMLSIGRHRADAPESLAHARRVANPIHRRDLLAFYGALDEAEQITRTLPRDLPRIEEELYGFHVAFAQRDWAAALQRIRSVEEEVRRGEDTAQVFAVALLRAEALLAAGRPAEAASVSRPPTWYRGVYEPDHASNYPRLALVRARAMEQLGRRADAIRELDGLLAFWKDADPDLPLLVEANQMRKRLASSPTARQGNRVSPG